MRDKLINKMAEAIYEEAKKPMQEIPAITRSAAAALDALLGELEEVKPYYGDDVDILQKQKDQYAKIGLQLLGLCK